MSGTPDNSRVVAACTACWEEHKSDCSGFVRAIAAQLGVVLTGNADAIVKTLRAGGAWRPIAGGVLAAQRAMAGKLVIAGLPGAEQADPDPNGHVVVVVGTPLAHDLYPSAWWGRLHGVGCTNKTLNYAWTTKDRDRVIYAEHDLA
jgi:hypothetical protein